MNNPTPKFGNLYRWDFNIKSAVSITVGSILFQFVAYFGFGMIYLPIVAILLALTLVGIIWLVARYNLIMTTFREGITVRAKMTERETVTTRKQKGGVRRSYYAKITYTVGGETFAPRALLPDDPIFLDTSEDGKIDLILREEKPKIFFFKQKYLE